jgi:acetyl esterase/lipase
MILICPGGGYNELMFRSEGTYAAQVLTKRGYTVGIICYRMPTGNGEIPLTDVQNAFRYCRHHAEEWGVGQIGIMGMSAGGHLAAMASTHFTDAITRPDFTILFYPVVSADPGLIHRGSFRKLTGLDPERIKEASEALAKREKKEQTTPDPALAKALEALTYYSPDRHITKDTPPALLFHSIDDGVNPENSLRYYERLIDNGVKAELHIFPSGGHGWGFNTLETAGRDKLEPWRTTFYDALFGFLENNR